MRIFLSAGEPSGDRHASYLVRALKEQLPAVQVSGMGGREMKQAGAELSESFRSESIIGVTAVFPRILYYRRLLRRLIARMQAERTQVLVLVDYPGFNLRLAEAAKKIGIKTVYYIGPQIWAWGPGRIKRIKRAVDLMLVVFEFEQSLYEEAGVPVRYVGHPLLDQLSFAADTDFRRRQGFDGEATLIGLFPGSRPGEIDRIFPVMLKATEKLRVKLKGLQVAAAVAPGLKPPLLQKWFRRTGTTVTLLESATHGLMQAADLALVASGTATLETALFGTPELVLYRTDPLTYQLGRLLIRLPRIGLVNVVAGREIAPEFIQHRCNPEAVAEAVQTYLRDAQLKANFQPVAVELRERLGRPGAASRAAQAIIEIGQL